MEAFFVSTAIVALAEMGDKTQLLALVLAARFRKPWPIVLGILVATLANHGLAGAVGAWVTTFVGPQVLRWILGASFIAMAIWMLIPDTLDDDESRQNPRWGVFGQCACGVAGRAHNAPGADSRGAWGIGPDFYGAWCGGTFHGVCMTKPWHWRGSVPW